MSLKIKFRIIVIWSIINNISKVTRWLLNNFKQSKSCAQYIHHWQLKDKVINQPTHHFDTTIWSRFNTQFYGQRTHPAWQPTLCASTIITAHHTTKGVEWQHKKEECKRTIDERHIYIIFLIGITTHQLLRIKISYSKGKQLVFLHASCSFTITNHYHHINGRFKGKCSKSNIASNKDAHM